MCIQKSNLKIIQNTEHNATVNNKIFIYVNFMLFGNFKSFI